jgi:hypothetical protein
LIDWHSYTAVNQRQGGHRFSLRQQLEMASWVFREAWLSEAAQETGVLHFLLDFLDQLPCVHLFAHEKDLLEEYLTVYRI